MNRLFVAVAITLALAGLALAACSDDTPGPHIGKGEEGNVRWRAERDPSSDRLTTSVWITSEPWRDAKQQERTATLLLYCSPTLRAFVLRTGEHQPRGDVIWRIEDGPEVAELWTKPYWAQRGDMLPRISAKMIRDLKGASRFSITTSGTPELVFLLDGALETPVQANIDNCGLDGWR